MNLMGDAMTDYLTWLATHGYATTPIKGRRHHLVDLSDFLEERGIVDPAGVTRQTSSPTNAIFSTIASPTAWR
jgi:hypothetical protein